MINLLWRWAVLALSVWVAAAIVPGVDYTDWQSIVIAALVLGILNTFVKPLITVLSIPFIILTLGLFLLVINALMLLAVDWIVPDFQVRSFLSALGGSVVISLVSLFLGASGRKRRR